MNVTLFTQHCKYQGGDLLYYTYIQQPWTQGQAVAIYNFCVYEYAWQVHLIINFNYLQHDGTTEHNMADTQV